MDRDWELLAICRHEDPDIWFSKRTCTLAKKICLNQCPVREECLEATLLREQGLARTDRAGIAAGLTGAQRAAIAKDRGEKPKLPVGSRGPGRPLARCGTRSAYQRHMRLGEPVDDACRAANAAASKDYATTGTTVGR
ncbi:WhiB family transcriptional regulator [Streptomyces nigra]|uniref:WhiB family transcriptional regulator n=1 Tax=Streptomyces nigra TaxID=1827580 RepID=UPI0037D0A774